MQGDGARCERITDNDVRWKRDHDDGNVKRSRMIGDSFVKLSLNISASQY